MSTGQDDCRRRAGHPSRKQAKRALRRTAGALGERQQLFEVYRCPGCGWWHVRRHNRPRGPVLVERRA